MESAAEVACSTLGSAKPGSRNGAKASDACGQHETARNSRRTANLYMIFIARSLLLRTTKKREIDRIDSPHSSRESSNFNTALTTQVAHTGVH